MLCNRGKEPLDKKVQRSQEELQKRREKMAAAAEARMSALKLASQQQQLWSDLSAAISSETESFTETTMIPLDCIACPATYYKIHPFETHISRDLDVP